MDVLNESFSDPASLKREVRFGLFLGAKLVTICKKVGLCEAKLHTDLQEATRGGTPKIVGEFSPQIIPWIHRLFSIT